MQRIMLKSKIHRATVTAADLNYEGSITIDKLLLDAADLAEYEKVAVWNVTNGSRLETYTMAGEAGSGVICLNGAAARLVARGDLVIIASFINVDNDFVGQYKPKLVFVDADNVMLPTRPEIPGPHTTGV
jgi:aspartate 1-decarboxylase